MPGLARMRLLLLAPLLWLGVTPAEAHDGNITVSVSCGANGKVEPDRTTYSLENITAAHLVNISFAPDIYTVEASAGAGGSLSPTGSVAVVYGNPQSFTATPEAGGNVACWWLDGRVVQTNGTTFLLDAIESNHVLRVTFALPVLSIKRTASNTIVLSWPQSAEGWNLQSATNLSAAPAAWTNISPPYPTDGENCYVIEPVLAGKKFYRLHHP